jgi:hypothetical protein
LLQSFGELTYILVSLPFRMLRRDGFSSESSSLAPVTSIGSGEADGKTDCPTLSTVLTRSVGALQDVFSIYPKAASVFRSSIRAAILDRGIKGTDFQLKKERMLILCYLIENFPGLDAEQTRALGDAVRVGMDKQKTLGLLKSFGERGQPGPSMTWRGEMAVISKEEAIWRSANNHAMSISDSSFLSFVKTIPVGNFSHDAADECEKAAYECLTTQLNSLVDGISQQILSIQKEECDMHVRREVKNEEEKELKVSRAIFVQNIENLCKRRPGSCAVYSSWYES